MRIIVATPTLLIAVPRDSIVYIIIDSVALPLSGTGLTLLFLHRQFYSLIRQGK